MIYATSDLHYGFSEAGDASVRSLASWLEIKTTPSDTLLVAGDIGTDDATFSECLRLFRRVPGTKCLVAGNHDVWLTPGSLHADSMERYRSLRTRASLEGFHSLDAEPIMVGDVGIAGSMGWYDGSFRDGLRVPESWYAAKTFPISRGRGIRWSDADQTLWPCSDNVLAQDLAGRLIGDVQRLRGAQHVVVLTHHLPTSRLLLRPRWLLPRKRRFFDSFMGSALFEEALRLPNVRLAICGHVHRHRTAQVDGVPVMSIGSTYTMKHVVACDIATGRTSSVRF